MNRSIQSDMRTQRYLRGLVALLGALSAIATPARADELAVRKGEVRFEPVADEEQVVPAPFRLSTQTFAFEQQPVAQLDDAVKMSVVTFPSPVKTAEANNNTVHCEYFLSDHAGQASGRVVLHFWAATFLLARVFANHLAHQGVAALFIQMPYYGERRAPDRQARMVSINPQETVAGNDAGREGHSLCRGLAGGPGRSRRRATGHLRDQPGRASLRRWRRRRSRDLRRSVRSWPVAT